jgi:hypothetical protein
MKNMRSKSLIAVGALAIIALAYCRKDSMTDLPAGAKIPGQHASQKVQQKMYPVSPEQVATIVENFKNPSQSLLVEADTIPIDSSIFVLEAALNYDLDWSRDDNYDTEDFTATIDVPVNEQKQTIGRNDLEQAYMVMGDQIRSHITPEQKVEIIDIDASIIGPNTLTFSAAYVIQNIFTGSPCGAVPQNGQLFYTSLGAMNAISPSLQNCAAPATIDGEAVLNQKLNCMRYMGCTSQGGAGYAYYNVGINYITSGGNVAYNNYPTLLFANQMHNNCTWCNTPAVDLQLTPTQLNTYLSNLNTYTTTTISAGGALPNPLSATAFYSRINCKLGHLIATGSWNAQCSSFYKSFGWDLKTTYGIGYCRTADPH